MSIFVNLQLLYFILHIFSVFDHINNMKNKSIWNVKKYINDSNEFNDRVTDILIIGGGITGVSTAYFLKNMKKDITLIDKGDLGCGITSKSTAKITYLQGKIYQDLENNFNKDTAKEYLSSQLEAINLIKQIIKDNNISCDLEKVPSIIFSLLDSGVSKIMKEKEILESFGIKVEDVINENIKAGIKIYDSYVFNPFKYICGVIDVLKDVVNIFQYTLAKNITFSNDLYQVETNRGVISAKQVVIACHYPFFLVPSFIPLKTYIKREYVNAAKVFDSGNYTAISIDNKLHSIRYYKNYLIYGSSMQRLTSKIDYKISYDNSRKLFKRYFGVDSEFTWMNQDIVSNDGLPFIGEVKSNLYIATAFNGWGMTNGVLAAKIIADLISCGKNYFASLFNPKRMNLPLFTNSLFGSLHYAKVYAQSLWKKNNPSYVKINGILYGVYLDELSNKHIVKLLCPHMKCNLVFNREEETWDCPCHGSRFDIDGNIIEGPAVHNIKKD